MQQPKFCANCKHCRYEVGKTVCALFPNLVSGRLQTECSTARSLVNMCGESGRLFEAKAED